MKLALVVPGGVDRSGEFRVIPVLLALIRRLACEHEVHVFALRQEASADCWHLVGAHIHNIGDGAKEEDILFVYTITGHFRWLPGAQGVTP